MISPSNGHDVKATMSFLPRKPLWDEEKPYHIRYKPHGDAPETNVTPEPVSNVHIQDLRPNISRINLETDGITVYNLKSRMKYEDFANPDAVTKTYLPELCELLKQILKTKNVAVLEYLVCYTPSCEITHC